MSGEILLVNPRRRRRKHKARRRRGHSARRHRRSARRHVARRRRHSFRVRRVRARRNPVALSVGGVMGTVKAGAVGAVGGLLNDLAFGYGKSYLPAVAQTGLPAAGVKILSAVAVGWLGNKVLKGKGRDLAVGAATVAIHDAAKAQLAQMAPSLPLGEYMDSYGNPSNPSLLGYNPGQVIDGTVSGDEDGVGEYILSDYNDDAF